MPYPAMGRVEVVRPFTGKKGAKYAIGDVLDAGDWNPRMYNLLIDQNRVRATTKKVTVEEGTHAEAF